jgi:hypothetical protein
MEQKEKFIVKSQIYRKFLIKFHVISKEADSSYILSNDHDAVMCAMDKYGKRLKNKKRKRC